MKNTPFKRIMVALDLTDMDEKIISYALWFASKMKTQKVYFAHFANRLTPIKKEFLAHQDDTPLDEKIREGIKNKLFKYLEGSDVDAEIIVGENHPLEGLLNWQKIKNTHLLIVGKKHLSQGSGVVSKQFVRQSDCPVLFVPVNAQQKIEKILVPVDFSDNSGFALGQAIQLSPSMDKPEIICQHVYFVKVYSGKLKVNSQFPKYVYQSAIKKNEDFLKQFELGEVNIKSVFTPDEADDLVGKINEYVKENKMDLIIAGAIGHSKVKLLTVGSTAEKMMLSNHAAPLMIIKK